MLLSRLLKECRHFRNLDFRNAVTQYLVMSGTLEAVMNRVYTAPSGRKVEFGGRGGTLATLVHKASRPGGTACSGRRVPSLEVRSEHALDAVVALQDGSDVLPHCNKVGLIFSAHVPGAPCEGGRGISLEEENLLGRTTWGEVFFTVAGGAESGVAASVTVSKLCEGYIEAGRPECLLAENVWLLRDADPDGPGPGSWREGPRELCAAVGVLPQSSPRLAQRSPPSSSGGGGGGGRGGLARYADLADRATYRAQAEAAVRLCCLLDCDGIVVGCAEGLCGSEIFGHPLTDVAEVWRDVLEATSAHFRRIAFAVGKVTSRNINGTISVLAEVLGARAAP